MFEDKMLKCTSCGGTFVFTVGEQVFYESKSLRHEPKACTNCRVLKRAVRSGKAANSTSEVDCANCGEKTRVPFLPKGYKPVYCVLCLQSGAKAAGGA